MRDASIHDLDSAPAGPVSSPERARQKIVLAVCLATGFATLLDQSVLNVAVPALRAELGAGRADVQWILAGYDRGGACRVGAAHRAPGRDADPAALFASRGFVLGTAVAMCWFGSALGLGLVVTLFLQEGLGLSPLVAGLCTLPAAVAMGISATLGWRVVGRYGRRSVTWMLGLRGRACVGKPRPSVARTESDVAARRSPDGGEMPAARPDLGFATCVGSLPCRPFANDGASVVAASPWRTQVWWAVTGALSATVTPPSSGVNGGEMWGFPPRGLPRIPQLMLALDTESGV